MAEKVATVYIHGGDYDCSEAVRMCYRAVGVLPYGSYMWTGNEVELLEEHDFIEVGLFEKLPGDVLWKPGHTEMYLGDGMQGGARIAENGGTTGKKGDQTGNEICRSKFDQSYWKWQKCLRYVGGVTVNGIPANVAAVQVMNHLIDHSAHGYSQPNRGGDGTVEAVTIKWNDGTTARFTKVEKPITYEFSDRVRVRTAPTTQGDTFQGVWWEEGWTATFDGITFGDGFIWGTYVGATTGKRLYAAIGTVTHGTPSI